MFDEFYYTMLEATAEMTADHERNKTLQRINMSKILEHVRTLEYTEAHMVATEAEASYIYWPDHVDAETASKANDREAIPFDVIKVLGPINNTMIYTTNGHVSAVENILVHRNGHVTLLNGGQVVGEAGHERVSYTLDDVPVKVSEIVVRYG
jgi:hypothetical protein